MTTCLCFCFRLETCINLKSNSVARRDKDTEEFLEKWLLTLRYENFQQHSLVEIQKIKFGKELEAL